MRSEADNICPVSSTDRCGTSEAVLGLPHTGKVSSVLESLHPFEGKEMDILAWDISQTRGCHFPAQDGIKHSSLGHEPSSVVLQ